MKPDLEGRVRTVDELTPAHQERMLTLLQTYFDGYEPENFSADLGEKDGVILLYDDGDIQGFTTYQFIHTNVDGKPIRGVFSGDTIVDRKYWGQNTLSRTWTRQMLTEAEEDPTTPLYWFLISSGYKTYRFLPTFFKEFYPRHDQPTPEKEQAILDSFALQKFQKAYDAQRGLVRFAHSEERLREGVAEITTDKLRNPHIRFFAERNPHHTDGVELACLAKISLDNYRSAALRIIGYEPATHRA